MRCLRRRFGLLVALLLSSFSALLSCTQEQARVDLQPIALPEGGTVLALASVRPLGAASQTSSTEEPARRLVAATRAGLFAREADARRWSALSPQWPREVADAGVHPLASLATARGPFGGAAHRLVGHDQHLWLLAHAAESADHAAYLLVSADGGDQWRRAELPTAAPDESSWRLVDRGAFGLYLLSSRRVWRAPSPTEGVVRRDDWELIDLQGVAFETKPTRAALPTLLRNYLPATPTRPYELLTVFSDQLDVYRRMRDAGGWVMVATLPTADRQLLQSPSADDVLMVTPSRLYRSRDFGERWEALPSPDSTKSPNYTAATSVARDQGVQWLVGTEAGAIYRSEDQGSTWTPTRKPDSDRRGIHALLDVAEFGAVFAGSQGQGVLRAPSGVTWAMYNDGLEAATPTAMALRGDGTLLLGTRAGLFEAARTVVGRRWDRVHARSTASVHVADASGYTFSGTIGGAIVVRTPQGASTTAQTNRFEDQPESIINRPSYLEGVDLLPESIVSLGTPTRGGRVFAWPHRFEPMRSTDGGLQWTPVPLDAAFLDVIGDASIEATAVTARGTLWLHARPGLGSSQPSSRVWRSQDDAQTWVAVRQFAHNRRHQPVHFVEPRPDAPAFYISHDDLVLATQDDGATWREIDGPWTGDTIRMHVTAGPRHALLLENNYGNRLVIAEDMLSQPADTRSLTLGWPGQDTERCGKLRAMILSGTTTFLACDDRLLRGELPAEQQQAPDGVALIITITALFFITLLSFVFLRSSLAD